MDTHYAYIRSILSYGIIFWGNSSNVNKLFILQKKIFRILSNTATRVSYREAFKNMEIMTLYSQYIFSLILFTVDNKHLFTPNNEIHRYTTMNNSNLHLPPINLTEFHKGPYIVGTKAFNHLLQYLKLLGNDVKHFKISLTRDFYIIILFTQLKNIMNTMRTKTCKSYYMGCDPTLYYAASKNCT
jgi:hypothetical protein